MLKIRISRETKEALQWMANRRDEPLGTMMALFSSMVGDVSKVLKDKMLAKANFDAFAIGTTISIGNLEVCDYHGIRFENGVSDQRRMPDAFLGAWMDVHARIAKLFGAFSKTEVIARFEPRLGCSIEQAIRERRFKEIARILRDWERQARPFDGKSA